MLSIKDCLRRWRIYRERKRREAVRRRAEEVFTIDDHDGKVWFFCNQIGMFPCSFVGLTKEDEIMSFLESLRKFYVDME